MRTKVILWTVILVISGSAAAEFVYWFYDLTELPAYWANVGFTFNSSGAYTKLISEGYPDSHFDHSRYCNFLLSDFLMIPPDLDSLVIDVSQNVILHKYYYNDLAKVTLLAEINGCETVELWTVYLDNSDLRTYSLTDSLPIHATMTNLNTGDIIQFRFLAEANATFNSYVEISWWLWDAQLTGYGLSSLIPRTWAGIKAAY